MIILALLILVLSIVGLGYAIDEYLNPTKF